MVFINLIKKIFIKIINQARHGGSILQQNSDMLSARAGEVIGWPVRVLTALGEYQNVVSNTQFRQLAFVCDSGP